MKQKSLISLQKSFHKKEIAKPSIMFNDARNKFIDSLVNSSPDFGGLRITFWK